MPLPRQGLGSCDNRAANTCPYNLMNPMSPDNRGQLYPVFGIVGSSPGSGLYCEACYSTLTGYGPTVPMCPNCTDADENCICPPPCENCGDTQCTCRCSQCGTRMNDDNRCVYCDDLVVDEDIGYETCLNCERSAEYCDCGDFHPSAAPPSENRTSEGRRANEPEARVTTDDDPHIPMGSLKFANTADRPMRMVSFEQEVGSGGNYLAMQLCDLGLSRNDFMAGYHHSRDMGGTSFVTVEEDSSVAGELVWSKMELDTDDHAKKLEMGLELVRTAMREDKVKLDMRCGAHLHIDVPDYRPQDIGSAYHLWAYMEDTFYRLGSANWKSHRTEVASHNYAPVLRKGAHTTTEALNMVQTEDRGALNFQPLIAARSRCNCGASRFGLWDECTCGPRMTTVEFRVFNTTANPIKLRAYIALCVGFVQYARSHSVTAREFPIFEWNHDTKIVDVPRSVERLRFIMDKLPMEAADRDAILYCIDRSSLKPCLNHLQKGA